MNPVYEEYQKLLKEKKSYWRQHKEGISAHALIEICNTLLPPCILMEYIEGF